MKENLLSVHENRSFMYCSSLLNNLQYITLLWEKMTNKQQYCVLSIYGFYHINVYSWPIKKSKVSHWLDWRRRNLFLTNQKTNCRLPSFLLAGRQGWIPFLTNQRVLEVFWVSYWLAGRGAINSCPIKTLQYSWGLLNFLLAIDGRRGNLFLTN